jgi:molecular chaperone GrpE
LTELLPVLDDIGRARTHGELEGGFKLVGESLEATVARLGLETFGVVGDAFDPMVHEAIAHSHSDEVTEATCVEVFQPGYRLRDKVIRPARVAVAEPE